MSHSTVLVIGNDPEAQLAPFDENLEGCETPRWDWYQLGGRWTGFFYVKDGAVRPELGEPGLQTNKAEPGTADACYKKDIDFDRMREHARIKAEVDYAHFEVVTKGTPWPESWASVRERIPNIDEAREIYGNQPMVAAMREDRELAWMEPSYYQGGREAFVNRAVKYCIGTFAVLKDGVWYERGEMGWWGIVADEKDEDRWTEEFTKLLDSVPDDTLLSVYDVHI